MPPPASTVHVTLRAPASVSARSTVKVPPLTGSTYGHSVFDVKTSAVHAAGTAPLHVPAPAAAGVTSTEKRPDASWVANRPWPFDGHGHPVAALGLVGPRQRDLAHVLERGEREQVGGDRRREHRLDVVDRAQVRHADPALVAPVALGAGHAAVARVEVPDVALDRRRAGPGVEDRRPAEARAQAPAAVGLGRLAGRRRPERRLARRRRRSSRPCRPRPRWRCRWPRRPPRAPSRRAACRRARA